ncbi:hypothetical protein QQZ08_004131 [Neonectria magnoliae]|uniref:Uncharacterized protein n=1 Tax=Neonectria magnoliae TaxID=2732573 RepID=A0ABR1I8G7_9HYPO
MRSWAVLLAFVASASAAECYYADGSKPADYDYQPCGDTKTTFSTCCYFGEGDVCLENGLCSQPDKHEYYRAACANQDWSNCPHVCMDEDPDNWLAVEKCGENKYCCPSSGSGCCTNGAKIYTLSISDSSNSTSDNASASGRGGASNTSSSDAESSTKASGGKAVPVGAIAGGVVGGIAVIGFLFVGFCCFKRRGKKAASPPAEGGNGSGLGGVETGLGAGESRPGNGVDEKKGYYVQTTPVSVQQQSPTEMEGSTGKVFTEADSKPVTGDGMNGFYTQTTPGSDHQQNGVSAVGTNNDGSGGYYAQTSQVPNSQLQQPQQQGVMGTGNDGHDGYYTQTDPGSNHHFQQLPQQSGMPVVGAGFDGRNGSYLPTTPGTAIQHHQHHQHQQHQHQHQETSLGGTNNPQKTQPTHHHFQQPQQHGLSEAVGSSGKVFTEVDSKPVTRTSIGNNNMSYARTSPVPSHQSQQSHQQVVVPILGSGVDKNKTYRTQTPPSADPQFRQPQQQGLSEAEGSSGKVFTEVDSKPITNTSIENSNDKPYYTQTSPTLNHQLGLSEAEGSSGKIFTEVDSKPITNTSITANKIHHTQPASSPVHQSQALGVAEVNGSPGYAFTEVDSKPITSARIKNNNTYLTQAVSSAVHQSQCLNVAEVNGSPGTVFTEADSKPVVPGGTQNNAYKTKASSSLGPAQSFQQVQQHGFTEVEGSSGKVFTEVDSKPISSTTAQKNTSHAQSIKNSVQRQESRQQAATEMEGSVGKVFTEADSTPITPTSTQAQQFQQFQQFQAFQQSQKMQPTQILQQRPVAEVEGSVGKVFNEADSNPLPHAAFDEKNAHEMPTTAVTIKQLEQFQKFQQFQQSQQHAAAEVEGSAGKIFTEADSKPINDTSFDEKNVHEMSAASASMQQFQQLQLFQQFQQAQQQGLAEVEGNLGNVFTEVDSRPVFSFDPEKSGLNVESLSTPEQMLRSHEME